MPADYASIIRVGLADLEFLRHERKGLSRPPSLQAKTARFGALISIKERGKILFAQPWLISRRGSPGGGNARDRKCYPRPCLHSGRGPGVKLFVAGGTDRAAGRDFLRQCFRRPTRHRCVFAHRVWLFWVIRGRRGNKNRRLESRSETLGTGNAGLRPVSSAGLEPAVSEFPV